MIGNLPQIENVKKIDYDNMSISSVSTSKTKDQETKKDLINKSKFYSSKKIVFSNR